MKDGARTRYQALGAAPIREKTSLHLQKLVYLEYSMFYVALYETCVPFVKKEKDVPDENYANAQLGDQLMARLRNAGFMGQLSSSLISSSILI